MANQRHPDQRLVAFALDKDLLEELERERKALGLDRSTFIRDAIVDRLQRLGIRLPAALADAPDRAGRPHAERPIRSYQAERRRQGRVSSKAASAAAKLLSKGAAGAARPDAK